MSDRERPQKPIHTIPQTRQKAEDDGIGFFFAADDDAAFEKAITDIADRWWAKYGTK